MTDDPARIPPPEPKIRTGKPTAPATGPVRTFHVGHCVVHGGALIGDRCDQAPADMTGERACVPAHPDASDYGMREPHASAYAARADVRTPREDQQRSNDETVEALCALLQPYLFRPGYKPGGSATEDVRSVTRTVARRVVAAGWSPPKPAEDQQQVSNAAVDGVARVIAQANGMPLLQMHRGTARRILAAQAADASLLPVGVGGPPSQTDAAADGSITLPPNPWGTSARWADYDWRGMAESGRRDFGRSNIASKVFDLIADAVSS